MFNLFIDNIYYSDNMSYFDRKTFSTRNILDNHDIEGSKPWNYIQKFQRRDPLKTDDIPGAIIPSYIGYTGADRFKIARSPPEFVYGPTKTQQKDQWFSPNKLLHK